MERFDVVIVGAGVAGGVPRLGPGAPPSRAAARAGGPTRATTAPGGRRRRCTGRYGNAVVRALTAASAPFYLSPPEGFTEVPLTRPRGVLVVAREDQLGRLEAEIKRSRRFVPEVERLDRAGCLARVCSLRPEATAAGMLDPTLLDLDVDGDPRGVPQRRTRGAPCCAPTRGSARIARDAGGWRLALPDAQVRCDVVVDAAGAWADAVAGLAGLEPLGIVPKRRTAITVPRPRVWTSAAGPLSPTSTRSGT